MLEFHNLLGKFARDIFNLFKRSGYMMWLVSSGIQNLYAFLNLLKP